MQSIAQKLWNDDCGQVALEYLLLLTIVGLGLVVGFAAVEGALNAEFNELANAILALSQGYAIATQSETTCSGAVKAFKQGSSFSDVPNTFTFTVASVGTPPAPIVSGPTPCP